METKTEIEIPASEIGGWHTPQAEHADGCPRDFALVQAPGYSDGIFWILERQVVPDAKGQNFPVEVHAYHTDDDYDYSNLGGDFNSPALGKYVGPVRLI